jgi:dienelactone hydrolase
MIQTAKITYTQNDHHAHHPNIPLHGFYAYNDSLSGKRPAVIVVHDWSGQNDFARDKAKLLAEMGYLGFAVDMYGNGQEGQTKEEKMALMTPLMEDRTLLAERILAAVHTVQSLQQVDTNKIAALGFCFGGLSVLDLARTGEKIAGVASFHGLLQASPLHLPKKIHAKVLALHGQDDPMAPPEHVQEFAEEMTTAQADWQFHIYGNTQHAFMNPLANDPTMGLLYNATTSQRAWQLTSSFLKEIFEG